MRLPTRPTPDVLPGVIGPPRAERPTRALLHRLRPGDIAVIDHVDLDRATAQALVDAGVRAVLNVQPMISGRYANLGPELLASHGVVLVEGIGGSAFVRIAETAQVRVHGGAVFHGEELLVQGREVSLAEVRADMARASSGLQDQARTLALNSTELLVRDADLLLNGSGLPALAPSLRGRPTVVVAAGFRDDELRRLRPFLREQRPVVIAVADAPDRLRGVRVHADVVVSADAETSAETLRAATEVVLCNADPEAMTRLGVQPRQVRSDLGPDDIAVLLAATLQPTVVVGVGLASSLPEFLDARRSGVAGAYLARLVAGPRLVDASAIPVLYGGKVRPWQMVAAVAAGISAVAIAVVSTPVGHHWLQQVVR